MPQSGATTAARVSSERDGQRDKCIEKASRSYTGHLCAGDASSTSKCRLSHVVMHLSARFLLALLEECNPGCAMIVRLTPCRSDDRTALSGGRRRPAPSCSKRRPAMVILVEKDRMRGAVKSEKASPSYDRLCRRLVLLLSLLLLLLPPALRCSRLPGFEVIHELSTAVQLPRRLPGALLVAAPSHEVLQAAASAAHPALPHDLRNVPIHHK